jgi:hypothetical protein
MVASLIISKTEGFRMGDLLDLLEVGGHSFLL